MADDRFVVEDHVPPNSPQTKSSGGIGRWILGCVFAAILTPFLLTCGCCGAVLVIGGNRVAQDAVAAVQNDPTFQAEIGKNASASIDYGNFLAEGSDKKVFNVTGENGSGKLKASYVGDFVISMVLEKDGKSWDLQVEDPDPSEYSVDDSFLVDIEDSPVLQAELGEIKHLEHSFRGTLRDDDLNAFHYEVVGEKGRGRITSYLNDDGDLESAKLEIGQRVVDLKVGVGAEEDAD
ncbi:cytochrome c oxidase assembly factor 1 family protein [Blastopirellula sp. JC732]|uniref:Cytochrome c oxidase assembly factor 1 family protein n=1 Tax=Blastopirellula sediminis TaxID=2894196 RepID=A0A9X1MTE6_9BACT|nr:cytochrome c oxidase assembly factor 1 family protein [Blastopirellula sediminis]MCC9604427.1 cytochrome c oxidase assembly factor 1 family protein [Blastopirellula sediminis]MCC9632274.1 cytochrome c oxidase assembly factor 1 family protein [Blastopirellula sediminis]